MRASKGQIILKKQISISNLIHGVKVKYTSVEIKEQVTSDKEISNNKPQFPI
jgi:hypothetical protein